MMRKETIAKCAAALVLGAAMNSQAQYSYTTSGIEYSQNFNSLADTGATAPWANDSTLDGWYLYNAAGTALGTYIPSTGTGTSGSFYSYGTTAADRALGGLGSGGAYYGTPSTGSTAGYIAFAVTNDTAGLLSEFTISFDGEQWRNGGNTSAQTMTLQYGFGSSFSSVTTWNTPGATFDWTSPIATATGAATDGNTVGLVGDRGGTIDGLTWNAGETLWIRWVEVNDVGSDHGLAIDNFTFNALAGLVSSGTAQWTNGANFGGDGTWTSSPDGNWDFGSDWDPNKTALFDLVPGTITIDGVVSANFGIMFANGDGNVITSGTLNLGGSVDVASVTATINSAITGTSGLTKTGSGLLVLGGTNAFTGTVKINGGLLQISEDANLGNAANDITLATGGGLKTISDVTLGSGRDVNGSGVLDVADGTTLTIGGAFNTAALTLANSGTVYLGGSTRTVGTVTFNGAGTLDGAGTISASGFNASNLVGTARVLTSLNMGSANITVDVGSSGNLALDGDILTAVGIQKTGGGILELNGNNSAMFRVRLGATGVDGGTVRISKSTSLGANQMFFNGGTLEATSDLTGANSIGIGVSIGAVDSAPAIFSGSNMTFTGSSGLFESATSANRINVNNTTTFAGVFTQGGSAGLGLVIGGSGTLKFTGDASGMTRATTVTDVATLVVDSSYGGAITVEAGATLKGAGTLLGLLQVSGIHAVGNSAGIQTAAGGVSYLSGSTFEWELVSNSSSTAGVDFDQLIVTGGDINIANDADVELVFNSVGSAVQWNDSFWDSDHTWTIVDNTGAGSLTGIFGLNDASEWFDASGFLLSVVNPGAYFEITSSGDDVVLNYYAVPIPEPSTVLLLGVSVAGLFVVRRRVSRR